MRYKKVGFSRKVPSKVGNGPKYHIVKFTYNFVLSTAFINDIVRKRDKNRSIRKNEAR